jgi:two-component system response regulator HydG
LLAKYFLQKANFAHPDLDAEILDILAQYSWPGNIREMKNILDRAMILAGTEPIDPTCIGIDDDENPDAESVAIGNRSLGESEKKMIQEALERTDGNKTEAAKMLGISRRRLYSRMKIHDLKP